MRNINRCRVAVPENGNEPCMAVTSAGWDQGGKICAIMAFFTAGFNRKTRINYAKIMLKNSLYADDRVA